MPTLPVSSQAQVVRTIRRLGIARPRDLARYGIHRAQLARLVTAGHVERVSRGVYVLANHEFSADLSAAIVATRVPSAVICLLTALRLHGLTTQQPHEVWIALPEKARLPMLDYPRLRVARFSGDALTAGIERRRIEGVSVRVYSAAKTVADCFKYRHKIGIDVAVEALRDYTRMHRGGATALARFARICRVTRVMQPYLDSLV
jgi:predicted transcriptional regulator of viral defense system